MIVATGKVIVEPHLSYRVPQGAQICVDIELPRLSRPVVAAEEALIVALPLGVVQEEPKSLWHVEDM